MAIAAGTARPGGETDVVSNLVALDGSAAHAHIRALRDEDASPVDLADAVHFLAMLHGRFPGVVDNAADRSFDAVTREWMFRASAAFAAERAFFTRLVMMAGPMPATLGQSQSENAAHGQSHALSVLSQSERRGTALGAAFALSLDWAAIRPVIDLAGRRFGLVPPPLDLPRAADTARVLGEVAQDRVIDRAMAFGAQQLLLQHRGLWDLLATRSSVRSKR